MIKIYLTNLGKYNEGFLIGKWVSLPCDDLDAELEEIGVSDDPDENGNYYEEYFITDYETDVPGLEIGEYTNIWDLNGQAEALDGLDDYELEAVGAFLENGENFDNALDHVRDGDYRFYHGCNDMEDVAYQLVDELDMLDGCPDNLKNYFDYKAFGRDLGIDGTFIFTNSGCCELLY